MNIAWLLDLLPLLALAVNVLSQIIAARLSHRIGFAIVTGFVCGLLVEIALVISLPDLYITLFTYLALSFCYWAFINLNITSLRIRILRELLHRPSTGVTTQHLTTLYSPQELVNRRLDRLIQSGQIKKQQDRWVLQSKTLLIFVFVSSLLRKIIMPSSMRHDFHASKDNP